MIPLSGLQQGKKLNLNVEDNVTFIESLALVDRYFQNHPEDSIFPIYEGYIHNYLQLFINLEKETLYEDVAATAYAPDENGNMTKFNPIGKNIYFNIYPDTEIILQPDSGC
ncbi:MAG: hypothetical protein EU547_04825 [Promethearchaeota archaeon]|nr:MAG: hypothetical protein EU547_04825 [Candidatus Lokiarchaeota archaeon]